MVWQPSAGTLRPQGTWQRLGIRRLLVQWTAVDNLSLVPGTYLPSMSRNLPDWERIAAEPWAQELTLGLAGMHDEAKARASLADLNNAVLCLEGGDHSACHCGCRLVLPGRSRSDLGCAQSSPRFSTTAASAVDQRL
jgi:hypothetical protein